MDSVVRTVAVVRLLHLQARDIRACGMMGSGYLAGLGCLEAGHVDL